MFNRKIFLAVLILGSFASLQAQDIHFSQYYASPLTLNPALTGNFNGKVRLGMNYRNQWITIPTLGASSPFITYQGSVDFNVLRNKINPNGLGLGLNLYHDRAGDGALTTQSVFASISYHKAIDRWGKNRFSLGMQGGVTQKRIDLTTLVFESQLDDLGWNSALFNNESNYNNKPITYPDFNVGVTWTSSPKDGFSYYAGYSMFHIAQPNETFLGDEDNRIELRHSFQGGMQIDISDYFKLSPTVLWMVQSGAQQLNAGLGFDYKMTDNSFFYGGVWTRVAGSIEGLRVDALIPTIGLEFSGLRMGANYDLNLSDFRAASKGQGAFEISVIYIAGQDRSRFSYDRYCPKF